LSIERSMRFDLVACFRRTFPYVVVSTEVGVD